MIAPVLERSQAQDLRQGDGRLFGFFGTNNFFGTRLHENDHYLFGHRVSWYRKARYMRKDATINFLRLMFAGRLMANEYSLEHDSGVPEEIVEHTRESLKLAWPEYSKHTSFGCMDFGWQGFELMYRLQDGYWMPDKVKPLLQDITVIQQDIKTGDFLGFRQGADTMWADDGGGILANFLPEGTYHYGKAPLKAIEECYDRQTTLYNQVEQYDGRLASTHWAIYYPIGRSPIAWDTSGNATDTKDNYEIAVETMNYLITNGSVVIPSSIDESMQRLNEMGGNAKGPWRIEVLSNGESAAGSPYDTRLKYYDTLKARGMGFPERSVFEGQHGTKAESESQGETSNVIQGVFVREKYRCANEGLIPDIVRTNFGDRYTKAIRVVPNPVTSKEMDLYRTIYERLMADPEFLFVEHEKLDLPQLRERLGIPVDEDVKEPEEEDRPIDLGLSEGCGANSPGGGGFVPGNT